MPAKFSILAISALPIIPIALACGGDDNNKTIKIPDAPVMVDAPVVCTAAATYPSPGAAVPGRSTDYAKGLFGSNSPHELTYVAALDNNSAARDVLFVDLYAGYGVFASGDITNGTFQIGGDDAKYSTCGLCVLIAADVTSTAVTDWYMATSGTVTLTKTSISQLGSDGSAHFAGSLTNVNLVHVAKDSRGGPGDMTADNCVSAIPTTTMDGKMVVGSAGGAVGGGESARINLDNVQFHFIRNRHQ